MRMRSDNLTDISAFGGLPIYLAVMLFFMLFGQLHIFTQLFISLGLAYAITTFFRIVYFRQRPDKQRYKNILERVDASSFPSLHAERATILAVTIALFFNTILLALLATLVAVAVALSRVMLKRHHITDVVAGVAFGLVNVAITITILPFLLGLIP